MRGAALPTSIWGEPGRPLGEKPEALGQAPVSPGGGGGQGLVVMPFLSFCLFVSFLGREGFTRAELLDLMLCDAFSPWGPRDTGHVPLVPPPQAHRLQRCHVGGLMSLQLNPHRKRQLDGQGYRVNHVMGLSFPPCPESHPGLGFSTGNTDAPMLRRAQSFPLMAQCRLLCVLLLGPCSHLLWVCASTKSMQSDSVGGRGLPAPPRTLLRCLVDAPKWQRKAGFVPRAPVGRVGGGGVWPFLLVSFSTWSPERFENGVPGERGSFTTDRLREQVPGSQLCSK